MERENGNIFSKTKGKFDEQLACRMKMTSVDKKLPLSDDLLVAKVKNGNSEAFGLLVQRYQSRVFSLVHRVVHIPEETEDLAQEIFVTIYRSLENFRGECAFSTWLYRITVNHCKNRLKYLQRRNFHRAQELEETSEKDFQAAASMIFANPEQQLLGKELEIKIQEELRQLDEEHRIILVLRDIEHLSYEEISEITKLRLGTVKSRLHRARSALKERMEQYL